jgi:putative hydrolase of the HAD superfamily
MALIFDFDGLIIDTESGIYEAWRELYAQHGQPLTLATWAQCIGSDFSHAYDPKAELERLTRQTFNWKAEEAKLTCRVGQLVPHYPVLPGVLELLQAAQAVGVPCAVASSSPRTWVLPHLERVGLMDYFHHVTTREDVDRIKPAPDLFLKAAERLSVAPAEVIVLEDSLNGLHAARAAGMRCVIAPGPTTQHLSFHEAWLQVSSLAQLTLERLIPHH